jgi:hypothetical protein
MTGSLFGLPTHGRPQAGAGAVQVTNHHTPSRARRASYLPDEASYAEAGYEVLSSPLCSDAAAITVAALIDLLPDRTPRRTA